MKRLDVKLQVGDNEPRLIGQIVADNAQEADAGLAWILRQAAALLEFESAPDD